MFLIVLLPHSVVLWGKSVFYGVKHKKNLEIGWSLNCYMLLSEFGLNCCYKKNVAKIFFIR